VRIRPAASEDAAAITAIYNQGVEERVATFQARPLDRAHFAARIRAGELFLVAEERRAVLGAAWVGDYDPLHDYYAGVGEATLYVERSARRRGTGRALLEVLGSEAARSGRHKLVAKIFASNAASLALFEACGYRRVGVHSRHGLLDGEWRDVVVVERPVDESAERPRG
jgi:L-amino acid N-acyltransferase YncA